MRIPWALVKTQIPRSHSRAIELEFPGVRPGSLTGPRAFHQGNLENTRLISIEHLGLCLALRSPCASSTYMCSTLEWGWRLPDGAMTRNKQWPNLRWCPHFIAPIRTFRLKWDCPEALSRCASTTPGLHPPSLVPTIGSFSFSKFQGLSLLNQFVSQALPCSSH